MATTNPPEPDNHDWTLEVPVPVDPGVYPGIVESIALREAEDGRPWLAWTFRLADGREVGGGTSFSLGPRTKAYAWVGALLGRARLGGGEQVTETDLRGARCRVVVELGADDIGKVTAVLPPEAE